MPVFGLIEFFPCPPSSIHLAKKSENGLFMILCLFVLLEFNYISWGWPSVCTYLSTVFLLYVLFYTDFAYPLINIFKQNYNFKLYFRIIDHFYAVCKKSSH